MVSANHKSLHAKVKRLFIFCLDFSDFWRGEK
jgi:hypothetical protein